jgi:hypothetical protein
MMSRPGFFSFLSFAVLLSVTQFSAVSHAQYLTGPVASAGGGAGRAAAEDDEPIFINPAALVHGSVFSSSLFFADGYEAKQQRDTWYGVSVADNSEDVLFSGGFTFVQRHRTFEFLPTRDEQFYQASMGRFVLPHLALGLSVNYLISDIEGDKKYEQWDGNIGAHYNPTPEIGLAIVFYNVGPRDHDVPLVIQNFDKVSVGTYYIFRQYFRLRADFSQQQEVNPDKKMQYQIGGETEVSKFWFVRAGFDKDELTGVKLLTAGFTFDGPRIKLDYFYRKNSDFSEGAMHGVDLRLPFW